MEGASVEAHTLMLQKGTLPLPNGMKSHRLLQPIDIGALADNFFRVSIGNPQREASESPIPGTGREVNELDVRLR